MRYLTIKICIIFSLFTYAQNQHECNMDATQEQLFFMQNTREIRDSVKQMLQNFRGPAEILPVKIHIMRQADGVTNTNADGEDDDPTDTEIDQMMVNINNQFLPVGIRFKECGDRHNIYVEDEYPDNALNLYPNFTTYTTFTEDVFLSNETVNSVVNILIVPELNGNNSCGNSSFPTDSAPFPGNTPDRKWIILDSDCINSSTPAHEMGHYFNLYHTHEDWNVWNTQVWDNAVERFARPPHPDSNCGETGVGDELCDTPADPHGLCRNVHTGYITQIQPI